MISIVVTLIIIGVLMYLVNTLIPMDGKIKQVINAVVLICIVLWLMQVFHLINYRFPR